MRIYNPHSIPLIEFDFKLTKFKIFIPWIAMALSIILWFKLGGVQNPNGSLGNTGNIYRIFFVVTGGVLGILLVIKNISINYILNPALLLMLIYGLIALFSALLVPANAFYTMWKSIEIIVDVMIIMGIMGASRNPAGAITAYRYIITISTITLIFVCIGAFISPSQGFQGSRGIIPVMLQGYFPVVNANGVGFISALTCIHNIAVWDRTNSKKRKSLAQLLVLLSLVSLILAQSRTSTVALLVGFILYLFFAEKKKLAFGLIIISSIVFAFTTISDVFVNYMQRGQSVELMTSLSGRTRGWSAGWELFRQSPWVGHGFAAAARTEILAGQNASTLHGAFFDVVVGVGVAGLIPWMGAILILIVNMYLITRKRKKWISNLYERSIHAELCAVTVMLIIRSITSSGISMHDHGFMILLSLIAYSSTLRTAIRQKFKLKKNYT